MNRNKKQIIPIVCLLLILVLTIYLIGPGWSPIASIRDSDGDGAPDSQDLAPSDKTKWAQATARFIVYMNLSAYDSQYCTLAFNGLLGWHDWLNESNSFNVPFVYQWLYGPVNSTSMTIEWKYEATQSGSSPIDITKSQTIVLQDGSKDVPFYFAP
jgi:hypothetical protein